MAREERERDRDGNSRNERKAIQGEGGVGIRRTDVTDVMETQLLASSFENFSFFVAPYRIHVE